MMQQKVSLRLFFDAWLSVTWMLAIVGLVELGKEGLVSCFWDDAFLLKNGENSHRLKKVITIKQLDNAHNGYNKVAQRGSFL